MSELFELFNFKTKAEWVNLKIEGMDDVEWLIAPFQNEAHQEKYAGLMESSGVVAEDAMRKKEIMLESFVNTVLMGWRGLTNGGNKFVYSEESAKKLLLVSGVLADAVTSRSRTMSREKDENFKPEELEENLKKL